MNDDNWVRSPRLRVLRAVEVGRHCQVAERLAHKAPEVLEALEAAAIDLNRCGEWERPSEWVKAWTVCVAPVGHDGKHFEPYAPELIALPDGRAGLGLL